MLIFQWICIIDSHIYIQNLVIDAFKIIIHIFSHAVHPSNTCYYFKQLFFKHSEVIVYTFKCLDTMKMSKIDNFFYNLNSYGIFMHCHLYLMYYLSRLYIYLLIIGLNYRFISVLCFFYKIPLKRPCCHFVSSTSSYPLYIF